MCSAQTTFLGFADFVFFMKKDEATWGRLSVHEKVKQTA